MGGSTHTIVSSGVLMDGDTDYTTNTGPGVELVRSLAKVELDLSIGKAGYTVISVQLRNISSRLNFFDALIDYTATPTYPDLSLVPLTDYEPAADENSLLTDVNDADNPVKFSWYVPRNARGKDSRNTYPKQKNTFAPEGATFFEIMARNDEGKMIRYRIYPGEDNFADFNVIPNNRYYMKLNITGDGGEVSSDSRIEHSGDVMFDGANNSFILNPPPPGAAPRTFSIPVTQVNRYWEPMWDGYGQMNSTPLNPASGPAAWEAVLLWQDAPDIVRGAGGDPEEYCIITKSTGVGGDDFFSVSVPAKAKHGNFVVALRRVGELDILWSWHLWVTNYNPDVDLLIPMGDRHVYKVAGGQVERYGGTAWGYEGSVSNNWNNYTYSVQTPTPNAPYARSFIMDRAIGALSNMQPYSFPSTGARGALCYQYGRKDPFCTHIPLYKEDGTVISATLNNPDPSFPQQAWSSSSGSGLISMAKPDGITVRMAVGNPMMFISTSNTTIDWSGLLTNASRPLYSVWLDNDPTRQYQTPTQADVDNHMGKFAKSIYDPCPQGWQLPSYEVAYDMRSSITTNNASRGLGTFSHTNGYVQGYFYGVSYWPYRQIDMSYPVEGSITIMLNMASRLYYSGDVSSSNYYCTSTLSSTSTASVIGWYYGGTGTSYSFGARAARCISDN
jgi:hypothetical protein